MRIRQNLLKGGLIALCAFLLPILSMAQSVYRGQVLSKEDSKPVAGVSVVITGTNKGVTTDAEGRFQIQAKSGEELTLTSIGMAPTTVTLSNETDLSIPVDISAESMSEVVVTALGIKKETKKLGYSVQEVKGADLIKAREPNPINSLTGKVAGLTVGASAELLGTPTVLLRGSNISLYVVDGVPINSDTWNISPDDIETFTILKGPSASALYGYRGQNGAIIITTKKGASAKKRVQVSFNSSTMFDRGFLAIPRVQDEYGPGDHGVYAFQDGKGGGKNDGDYDIWGPKFDGQLIPQYDGTFYADRTFETTFANGTTFTGNVEPTPYIARGKDNLKRFIQTGLLATNNIAVSSSSEKSDLRFSVSNTYQKGIVPYTSLNTVNFNLSNTVRFTDRLTFESNINYNRQFTDNFPDVVYGPNSIIYNMNIWGGADWDVESPDIKAIWKPGQEGVQQVYAEYKRYHNPWFMVKEWTRGHYKNDVYGYASLNYKVLPNLSVLARTSITTYDLFRNEKMPFSAHPYGREEEKGDYREDRRALFENNTEVLVSYSNQTLVNGLQWNASVGGNYRNWRYGSSFATTDYLNVPEVYNFSNSLRPVQVYNYNAQMAVSSVYGFIDLSYKKYLTVSVTGRADKLSTLPDGKNTYFYPSGSVSTVISDYVQLPSAISFLKLKFAMANVKGGLTQSSIGPAAYPLGYGSAYYSAYEGPTYQNSANYNISLDYNNEPAAYYTNLITNENLKPFSRTNYEGGVDIRFLRNRLALDATYFVYNDGPGIFQRSISQMTGYTSSLENGIETQRKGVEISLTGNAVKAKTANGISWDVLVNWSTYREVLTNIYEGLNQLPSNYFVGGNRGDRFISIGDRIDAIYGSAFARTPDGQLINDGGGRPIVLPKGQFLGYANPDWVWGINNKFQWKAISFSFQFDGRVGGSFVNYIQKQTFRGGRNIQTVQGAMGEARYQDYLGVKSWLGEGVAVSNGGTITYDPVTGQINNYKDLQYADNATKTFLQDYISRYYNTEEGNVVSKTFSKLREVTIGYNLPQSILGRSFIKQASISLVGRNLFYFSKVKDVDLDQYPGLSAYSSLQTPTTRRYGVNLNINF